MPQRRPSQISLSAALARAIAAHLEQDAEELIVSFYSYRAGKVTPVGIRREIERCTKWAKLLRGGSAR